MSSGILSNRNQPIPQRTSTIAMWLFLVALAMLFAASMLGYVMIRTGWFGNQASPPPERGALKMPLSLWVSTLTILLASITMHLGVSAVRREKQGLLKGYLIATLALSVAFILVQAPSLFIVLSDHHRLIASGSGNRLYGLVFFLVLVHALHVIGGLIYLLMVMMKAYAGKYDHEHYIGVRHAALYWHFLDVVWIVMFGTMVVLR